MVTVVLSTGEELTGTPNHPVLTQRGWVALGELDEAHDCVGRLDRDLVPATAVAHHVEDVPPALEQVFDLAGLAAGPAGRQRRLAREGDFHGDVSDGEIDVVAVHGLLKGRLEAAFTEKFGEDALPIADEELSLLSGPGLGLNLADFGLVAAPSGVGGACELFALGGGSEMVPTNLFLVPAPDHAVLGGDVVDRPSVKAEPLREGAGRLSSRVGFSDIASKRFVDGWVGHVFNLETSLGWYEANGVVAHNCPVGEGTRLETLAKALTAAPPDGDPPPAPGSVGPKTGEGAGYLLSHRSVEGVAKPGEPTDPQTDELTKSEAIFLIRERLGCDEETGARVYETFASLKARGEL
jgi:hypothetical protein